MLIFANNGWPYLGFHPVRIRKSLVPGFPHTVSPLIMRYTWTSVPNRVKICPEMATPFQDTLTDI